VIEVAVGQDDGGGGGVPRRAGVEAREPFDLLADFRRGVQQEPRIAVGADRD
jgi:hypothetical protein